MALLQKLLSDRNEVVVLHQSSVFCSCGAEFEDFSDVENHVVKHPRVQVPRRRSRETANLILRVLTDLSERLDAVCAPAEADESVLTKIDLPEKVCGITLEEEDLNAGIFCFLLSCRKKPNVLKNERRMHKKLLGPYVESSI